MGRHKEKDRHLPPRMIRKGKAFYHRTYSEGRESYRPLGSDYIRALLLYRDLEGLADGAESVCEMLDNALAAMTPDLKPSTVREFTRACNRLKIAFKGFAPMDVEPVHITQYLENRADDEGQRVPVTANREIAFFSAAWDKALRKGWLKLPNPTAGIKRNPERSRKRIAKPGEIRALLLDERGLARDCVEADMVELTLRIGIREADMLHMKPSQLEDLGVRVKPRKTDNSTEVEMLYEWTPELRTLFDRVNARRAKRVRSSIYLFGVTRGKRMGQPYTCASFYKVFRKYFTACGVTELTWHDLRRTALNMAKEQRGKEAAQEFAGHSSITTTEGYLSRVGAVVLQPISLKFGK